MKLRIQSDSLRLRLGQSEVLEFGRTGKVGGTTSFGPGSTECLSYSLESSDQATKVEARFTGGRISVVVPEPVAREWTDTDQVGFNGEVPVGEGRSLSILVEKDFKCLSSCEGEDERDAFPHPEESTGKHPSC
jgi:hypothetical protein